MSSTDTPTKTMSDFEAKLEAADQTVAQFDRDDKTAVAIVRGFLRDNPTLIPALVLFISVLAFGVIAQNFLKPSTLSLVMQQVTVTGFVALAQTVIILTAGIDLSVGEMLLFSSLVMGNLAVNNGMPTGVAIAIGIAVGTAMGALNGVLVARMKLPPFIVTLGTLSIYRALKLA